MNNSFDELLEIHSRLDELFLEHQRGLLRLDLTVATAALEAYELELFAHMADEEDFMLPVYEERAVPPVGGAAEIFRGEHEKLRQYVVLFKECPGEAARCKGPRKRGYLAVGLPNHFQAVAGASRHQGEENALSVARRSDDRERKRGTV